MTDLEIDKRLALAIGWNPQKAIALAVIQGAKK